MDEDSPITQAFAEEAVERLVDRVRQAEAEYRWLAVWTRGEDWPELADYYVLLANEAAATLRLALGREEGGTN